MSFVAAPKERPAVANAVAQDLGIDTVFAEVLDGVNDAPALVTADVTIAIGAGTDIAVEAGDVVLVRSDPMDVPRIIALSRASYRKMVQNLWWAAGYNVFAIPLAAGARQLLAVQRTAAHGRRPLQQPAVATESLRPIGFLRR